MNKGLLIIISGPSGVGKDTIRAEFMNDEDLHLTYSISMTSRNPREGEKEGVDYYFVSKERFKQAIENGEMLEWAEYVGNYYGTPLKAVETLRQQGKNVLLEIEVEGASSVMKKCPDAVSIFITPPSLQELENRIRLRATESEDTIKKRLEKAKKELEYKDNYKYVVCNKEIKQAANEVRNIIKLNML